jgi:hypothetical protein
MSPISHYEIIGLIWLNLTYLVVSVGKRNLSGLLHKSFLAATKKFFLPPLKKYSGSAPAC